MRLEPTLLLLTALGVGVIGQGGFYLPSRVAIAVLVMAAALLALRSRPRLSSEIRLALIACAALAAWAVLRAGMAGDITSAGSVVATLGVIAGVLVVLVRADTTIRHLCVASLIGLSVLVALAGWVGVIWRREP